MNLNASWRHFLPSVALAVVCVLGAVFFLRDQRDYEITMNFLFSYNDNHPLSDFKAVLDACRCWSEGVDVYYPNQCMGGGAYNYSPFLLRLGRLPISPDWAVPGAVLTNAGFIAALCVLPAPGSRAETWVRTGMAVATGTLMALESANIDLIVFALVALCLVFFRTASGRVTGYLVFTLLSMVKFYPVVVLGLVLRERVKFLVLAGAVIAAILVVFELHYRHDNGVAYALVPSGPPFGDMFGSFNLPFGLMLLAFMPHVTMPVIFSQVLIAMNHPGAGTLVALGIEVLTALSLALAWRGRRLYAGLVNDLAPPHLLTLVAGAALMVGCFLLAQNRDHRSLFLIFTTPGLFAMLAAADGRPKTVLQGLIAASLILIWESVFRDSFAAIVTFLLPAGIAAALQIGLWILRECLWWWVITQFMAILMVFIFGQFSRLEREVLGLIKAKPAPHPAPAPEGPG
jgi:hypothetical protein